jgi:hypothetical protein
MNKKLEVGTKIYYTGDQANLPAFGEITKVYTDEYNSLEVTLEDGRVWKKLGAIHFQPSIGRRFMTLEEYKAERKARLEILEKRMMELKRK